MKGHLCSSALIIHKLRLWKLLSTTTFIKIKRWKRDLRLEKALHCLSYITFGTWRHIMSWLDITYFLQWHALHCCAPQRCSKMFPLALIEVPIEFISAKWLVWNCRKPWPSEEATIKLSLVYNHFGGLACRWALQFSTFPDEWYSKAYFHSHIINTFLPTPASNIPNHFRQCAHAILDRHERRRWGEKLRQLSDVAAECLVELY